MNKPVLKVEALRTYFQQAGRVTRAVDDVSFELRSSETLGLAGESGCGKTVTSLSIMRLVPSPAGRIVSGRILLDDRDLLALSEEEMRRVRGRDLSMVFQEPMTALNPVYTVGNQLGEVFRTHFGAGGREARRQTVELLAQVGIPDPSRRFDEYPHQMSGGMRQRVLIAMALAGRPKILVADEPTTALDVTIQAQILELMGRLSGELGMGTLLITHDLGVLAELAQRVAIMYAGRIVESGGAGRVFQDPYHPYTAGLLKAIPATQRGSRGRLNVIPGSVPDLSQLPPGCAFEPRCPRRRKICQADAPPLEEKAPGLFSRCWVAP